jgi:hypothetical protein
MSSPIRLQDGRMLTTTLPQSLKEVMAVIGRVRGYHTQQPFAVLQQPSDQLYYWDGPWGVLAGSAGVALVRNGRVVDLFQLIVA